MPMKHNLEQRNAIATDHECRNVGSLLMRLDNWAIDPTALPEDEADDKDVTQQPHGGVVRSEADEALVQAHRAHGALPHFVAGELTASRRILIFFIPY